MHRILTSAMERLDRFNTRHPWSHNEIHSRWIMRQARLVRKAGGSRALDIGCGTGKLLLRLAPVMSSVVGLEPDERAATLARATVAGYPNIDVRQELFNPGAQDRYDLVTLVAVLHHLPLSETLASVRNLLRPGGRLVIVGVFEETAADLRWVVPSVALNPILGLMKHPRRAAVVPENMTAPVAPPTETFAQVAAAFRRELPGSSIRRALFWRYRATWRAPVMSQ